MRGHHHRRPSVQSHLDARDGGANARVFGDVAVVVLRHVQVSADEDAFALELTFGDEVGEADDGERRRCRHGGLKLKYLQNWSNGLTTIPL